MLVELRGVPMVIIVGTALPYILGAGVGALSHTNGDSKVRDFVWYAGSHEHELASLSTREGTKCMSES